MAKDSILILADSPIFNPRAIVPYPNLSTNYSVYLNTLLFSNWLDNLSAFQDQFNLSAFLSEMDKDYLPNYIMPDESKVVFYKNKISNENLQDMLTNSTSIAESKTLVIYFNSIGFRIEDIFKLCSLVQIDEPTIAVVKSDTYKINCFCVKQSDAGLVELLIKVNRSYDEFLKVISHKDYLVHIMKNFLSIDDFEDIKKLYIELSKKESLSYCSQKMHESFNDLFIEYKELLNV